MGNDEVSIFVQSAVGLNISTLRTQRDLSQVDFARMVSVDRSYVNQIENGKKNPTIKILTRIADGLDVPITELFTGLEIVSPWQLREYIAKYSVVKFPQIR